MGKIENPVIAAYLRVLLLTGARPGEIVQLKWSDINRKWKGITILDKVEGERIIPLTSYVAHLLGHLPKRNEWVFSGGRVEVLKPGKAAARKKEAEPKPRPAAPISRPQWPHALACKAAGIEGLTLHGLRRSFSSLTEWLEVPAGVVAPIMGHKPSATAEKHYIIRPVELLRMHHEKIEAWMLEQAGIEFDAKVKIGLLQNVAA